MRVRLPKGLDRREAIASKCHPAIFEVAALLKEHMNTEKNSPVDPQKTTTARFHEELERVRQAYPDFDGERFIACAIWGTGHMGDMSGWPWEADLIHFVRYGTPLRADLAKRKQGDWEATRRALQTEWEYEELRCRRKSSLGKFKRDFDHWLMFVILWSLGIEELTPEELADFFDWFCHCGNEHSAEGLKKQRRRLQKLLKSAHEWGWSQFKTPEDFLAAASPAPSKPPTWW